MIKKKFHVSLDLINLVWYFFLFCLHMVIFDALILETSYLLTIKIKGEQSVYLKVKVKLIYWSALLCGIRWNVLNFADFFLLPFSVLNWKIFFFSNLCLNVISLFVIIFFCLLAQAEFNSENKQQTKLIKYLFNQYQH